MKFQRKQELGRLEQVSANDLSSFYKKFLDDRQAQLAVYNRYKLYSFFRKITSRKATFTLYKKYCNDRISIVIPLQGVFYFELRQLWDYKVSASGTVEIYP